MLALVTLGRPWGITSGLTLWAAQIAHAFGIPVADWPYWTDAVDQVKGSTFADGTSVMNLGLISGAALAASLAGRFAPKLDLTARDVAGRLLMGYGARLAYGCNIGALLGGIASGSLHGWVWFARAFGGSIVGVRLRMRLGIDPPIDAPPHAALPEAQKG